MQFKIIAYLILFYTGLAIITAVYVFLVIADWLKRKCLITYVQNDSSQGVQRVLASGVNLNEKNIFGKTPLMGVVRYAKNAEMLKGVLNQADVNIADEAGMTPLMVAAQYNTNIRIFEMLVYEGAQIRAVNNVGQSALMIAAQYNTNPSVIRLLVDTGSDINAVDNEGHSALMYAAQYNPNPHVLEILLSAGADKAQRSLSGQTAFDYAHENIEIYKTQQYYALEAK